MATAALAEPIPAHLKRAPVLSENALFIEEQAAKQFAHLASQHHASEYNSFKFGPGFCPVRYTPLSLQMPDHYRQLQLRQVASSGTQAWWYHDEPASPTTLSLGPCGANDPSLDLVSEISAAMDEPLILNPEASKTEDIQSFAVKTSVTHPINISMLIPPECISLISSHVLLAPPPSPTVLDVPPAFTLDRLVFSPTRIHPPKFITPPASNLDELRARSQVPEALEAAINSAFPPPPLTMPLPYTPPESPVVPIAMFHSNSSSLSLSLSMTLSSTGSLATKELLDSTPSLFTELISPTLPLMEVVDDEDFFTSPIKVEPGADQGLPTPPQDFSPTLPPQESTQRFTLGNMYMSSCPGKKVRLQGPVRGRSGVCRDLGRDVRRMKEMGVGCIVCCLDDEELEFLGAPWEEYVAVAREVGMDILRLPTPEGLPPALCPQILDDHLEKLIERYTMKGVHVLVHCRGGVGRAGIVACCWMLKMGLCGSMDDLGFSDLMGPPGPVRADTLWLVERVICVVRRRRSVKAIETYEQVRFLVEYVDFLRAGAEVKL